MAFMALQAAGDDSAHLIYEFERRAYPVRNSLLTIGRDAASHILIREPAVSRNHAELRAEDGKFVLHPCGVNPTTVNGAMLTEPKSHRRGQGGGGVGEADVYDEAPAPRRRGDRAGECDQAG